MKATMESTSKTTIINGMQFRIWEGVTDKGVPFVALVNRLASGSPENQSKLVQETMLKHKEPEAASTDALRGLGVA